MGTEQHTKLNEITATNILIRLSDIFASMAARHF